MDEWEQLTSNRGLRGIPFESVTHTAHVGTALSILESGEILPSVVYDDSILKGRDVSVTWFSPNVWNVGYRYGTVNFRFDFASLVAEKESWWVEIAEYEIRAPRILIGSAEELGLERYDPTLGNGPWSVKNGRHSFRNDACLEILMRQAVSLDQLSKIEFVNHHDKYCSMNRNSPKDCPELGINQINAAGRFLAAIVATRIDIQRYEHVVGAGYESRFLGLTQCFDHATFGGVLDRTSSGADDAINDFCIGVHELNEAKTIAAANQFSSPKEISHALLKVCRAGVSSKYFEPLIRKVDVWYRSH